MSGSPKSRTFFVVLHQKSLEKILEKVDWENPQSICDELVAYCALHDYGCYCTACRSSKDLDHVHAVITVRTRDSIRVSALAKTLGKSHVEYMCGTKFDALSYIRKEGKYAEKGEFILAEAGNPDDIQDNSGSRSDIRNFDKLAAAENFCLEQWLLEHCKNSARMRYYRERYMMLMAHTMGKSLRNVRVIYVQGETGSGKSHGAYERFASRGMFTAACDGRSCPFDGYQCEPVLHLEELRPGQFSFAEMMRILDIYPYTVNIKGGHCPACWDTVVITTAFPLSEWYKFDRSDAGSDVHRVQFMRRISEAYIAKEGEWIPVDKEKLASTPLRPLPDVFPEPPKASDGEVGGSASA